LAKEAGAESLVHVSAIGANPDSRSRYARTKAEGEAAVRKAFPEAVIVRPSIIIGPEDQFFNRFAALARFSPVVPVIGGGRTRFQPVFVGDVAEAIVKAVADPSTHGRTYELGGPAVYTFRELMEYMLATVRRRRPLVSVPFPLAKLKAVFLGLLPKPLLTLDQVRLLRYDNVVADESAGTFRDLGIEPRALDVVVPSYLERFRPRGQFQQRDLA
jgi:NADH dehydrogenase